MQSTVSILIVCVLIAALPVSVSADVNGTWEPLLPPSGRQDVLSAYDPVHDRLLVFGGNSTSNPSFTTPFGELWSLDFATWTWQLLLPSAGGPGFRYQSSIVYDSTRNRILLFGGARQSNGTEALADVWSLSVAPGSTWQAIYTFGGSIPPRANHVAIYDPVGDRLIVNGGLTSNGMGGWVFWNDTWQLTFSGVPTWSQLSPTNAPSRYGASAIYDPVHNRRRMLVFGGIDASGIRRNEIWALDLRRPDTWELVQATAGPSARSGHTAVYDPGHDSMIVYGGNDPALSIETWVLELGRDVWTQLNPSPEPWARTEHTAIFDASRNRMVVFGGSLDIGYGTNEVWILDPDGTGSWSQVSGTQALARDGDASFFDPVRNRMVIFSGSTSLNDTWARPTLPEASWTQLFPAGTPPPGTSGDTFVYDPTRDRAILFGGLPVSTLWSLDLANGEEWVQLFPTGPWPPARVSHTAVYDGVRDRMLVFGGGTSLLGGGAKNDLWELRFGTNEWSEIVATGTPPAPRRGAAAVLDPKRDRMLVFGGGTNTSLINDVWALSLDGMPTWTQLSTAGMPPSPRKQSRAFYDLVLDRMVLFGGSSQNDLWELNGSTAIWSRLSPGGEFPPIRTAPFGVYDSNQRNFYTGAGSAWGENVWTLHLGPATTGIEDNSVSPVSRVTASPNPFRGSTNIRFHLNQQGRAELTIHDLNGRRVATPLPLTVLPAGPQEIQWRPAGLGSGIYFYKLLTPLRTQSGRIVFMQ